MTDPTVRKIEGLMTADAKRVHVRERDKDLTLSIGETSFDAKGVALTLPEAGEVAEALYRAIDRITTRGAA